MEEGIVTGRRVELDGEQGKVPKEVVEDEEDRYPSNEGIITFSRSSLPLPPPT